MFTHFSQRLGVGCAQTYKPAQSKRKNTPSPCRQAHCSLFIEHATGNMEQLAADKQVIWPCALFSSRGPTSNTADAAASPMSCKRTLRLRRFVISLLHSQKFSLSFGPLRQQGCWQSPHVESASRCQS